MDGHIRTTPLKREELLLAIFVTLLKNQWEQEDEQARQLLPLFSE